jgi:hypothetical protein
VAIPDIGWPHIRCLATCSPKLRTQFADLISLVAAIFQLASHAYKAYQYYILPPIHPSSLFHQTLETEKVSNHLVADMAYDLALFHAFTNPEKCVHFAKMIKEIDQILKVAKKLGENKIHRLELYNHIVHQLPTQTPPLRAFKYLLKCIKEIYPIYNLRAITLFREQKISLKIKDKLDLLKSCCMTACTMTDLKDLESAQVCMETAYDLLQEISGQDLLPGYLAIAKAHFYLGETSEFKTMQNKIESAIEALPAETPNHLLMKIMHTLKLAKFDPSKIETAKDLCADLPLSYRKDPGCKILALYKKLHLQVPYNAFFDTFFADFLKSIHKAPGRPFDWLNQLISSHSKSFTLEKIKVIFNKAKTSLSSLSRKNVYKLSLLALRFGLKDEIAPLWKLYKKAFEQNRRANIAYHLALSIFLTLIIFISYLCPSLRPLPMVVTVMTLFLPRRI